MRIGIDARILGHPRSGIAVYTINLLEQFLKYPDLEIVLFGDRAIWEGYKDTTSMFKNVIFGQEHRKRWSQFYLPGQLKRHRIDIYHATWNNAVPLFTRVPVVLTLHDIIPMIVPGYFTKFRKRIKYVLQCYICSHRAVKIITVSEHERNVLIKRLHLNPDKVEVTYNSVDDCFRQPVDGQLLKECLKRYGIDYEYVINGGGIDQPKRNALNLISAFSLFLRRHPKVKLVLVGHAQPDNSHVLKIKELIYRRGLAGSVVFAGQASRDDLLFLLKGSRMMVFPSVYESFGIPVLEAMALGVPVITSAAGALAEISGGAARLIDPHSAEDISEAMDELYTDENKRNELVKAGIDRIGAFSWEKTALKTLDIYKRVISD